MQLTVTEKKVFDTVKDNMVALIPTLDKNAIQITGRLVDYGCNSMDRSDIVWQTLDDLGLDIPVCEFTEVNNIHGLVKVLASHVC